MNSTTYLERRSQLEHYFDRTAMQTWARLTSDAPVSRIRATVRAGRAEMRSTLLSMLPMDLSDRRILDAGCGTGALALEMARRGATVVAIDLSPNLVELARQRLRVDVEEGQVHFLTGDMSDPALGCFDHVVAMDSLIHYRAADIVKVLAGLAPRCRLSMLLTFAPRTPLLATMHAVGKLFPRSDRAPAIEPVAEAQLHRQISGEPALNSWMRGRSQRISRGFYKSNALELRRT
jgi:magnesium-protoporphyrin O-methyltransferase